MLNKLVEQEQKRDFESIIVDSGSGDDTNASTPKKPNLGAMYSTMRVRGVSTVVDKIINGYETYLTVQKVTNVPWELIGCLHHQEYNCNFKRWLGNGQPLDQKSTIVPKGYGPFKSWEEGAVVALNLKKKPDVWTIVETLRYAEKYNGLGYRRHGVYSPYIWAYTQYYTKGHYVADGKFDANKIRKKPGVAPVLRSLL